MSTLSSTPSLSYNELSTLHFDFEQTRVHIITALHHPLQPEPQGRSFIVPLGFTTLDVATASHALEEPRFSAAGLGLSHPIPLDRPRSPIEIDGHDEFIVDRILDYQVDGSSGGRSYLIRWLGYDPLSDSYIAEDEANKLIAMDRWQGIAPISPALVPSHQPYAIRLANCVDLRR
ncbi:hypothetical protein NMY22_g6607 [Coprinellus aureogranulatus]|nr:hypothetical protein NMY22_g6607 [Coprinellus aureogranulatus]